MHWIQPCFTPSNYASSTSIQSVKPVAQATYDPFHQPIIDKNEKVNINNIQEMQRAILDTYPTKFFNTFRSAVFHLNCGANVHATNDPQDFIIFHLIKTDINLAVGSKTHCEGIGAILTQLTPTSSPVILAPIYYCPTEISTISLSALKHYNQYIDVAVKIHKSLEFKRLVQELS